ncbi:MAG TPA: DUF2934 domain-containing protein [Nitrospira sp.]
MKVRMAPGSRQKVRAASSEKDAGSGGSGSGEIRPSEDVHTRIALLAYRLYEERGREDGSHVEDWLQAEEQIRAGRS